MSSFATPLRVGLVVLAGVVGQRVLEEQAIGAFNGFLYADNLSALVVGLTAFVSLYGETQIPRAKNALRMTN